MSFRNIMVWSIAVGFTSSCAVVNRFGPGDPPPGGKDNVPSFTQFLIDIPDYVPEPLVLPSNAPPRLLSRIAVHDSNDAAIPIQESSVRVNEGSELVFHIYVQRPEEIGHVGIQSAFTDLYTTLPRKLHFLQPKANQTFSSAVSEVGFAPNLSHVGGGTISNPVQEVELFTVRAQVKGKAGETFDVRTGSDSRWADNYPVLYSDNEPPTGIAPTSLTIRIE